MAEEPERPEGGMSFEEAKERLRSRGYLDRGVEGAVLKGALAARTKARGLLRAAGLAAAFLAVALALAQTAALTASAGLPPRDVAVLFLWLVTGALLFGAGLVAALLGLAWARTRGRGDADAASTEIGIVFGLLAGAFGAAAAVPALEYAGPVGAGAVLVGVALTVFVAVRIARSVTLTLLVASGRSVLARRGRGGALAALAVALLALAAAGLFALRSRPPAAEPLVVAANARRVVVVAVDGWSDRYVGSGPFAPLGVAEAAYEKETLDPAAFWTTVATGEPVRRHGVGSLDLVRVGGVRAPLRPVAGTRWYLASLLPALGAARLESVTSAARRVPAMWEVAPRAGVATLVVGWWTTYPADEAGATVLSNHLFFAARAGASLAGEGWPPDATARAAALAPRVAPEPGSLDRLLADAEGVDDFAIRAFLDASLREKPRLSLLYLPGLDILSAALSEESRRAEERVALAEALRKEAARLDAFLRSDALRKDVDLLVLLLDGGRKERAGRAVLSGPLARAGANPPLRPLDLAPTLLSVLGIPASRETAGQPAPALVAHGALATGTVGSWGRRAASSRLPVNAKEYVENLRSLGYLK